LKTSLQNYIGLREDPVFTRNAAVAQNLEEMQTQLKTLSNDLSASIANLERLNKQVLGARTK
jgi:hypothetical protein